jgi:hypothetical protein
MWSERAAANSSNFAANAGRTKGRLVRFAAESLALADGTATMTGNFAADLLQMQQTGRPGFNFRL